VSRFSWLVQSNATKSPQPWRILALDQIFVAAFQSPLTSSSGTKRVKIGLARLQGVEARSSKFEIRGDK
jgi:hypothetical protein